jgi:hypothetical protein
MSDEKILDMTRTKLAKAPGLLDALETAVLDILSNPKSKTAEKLSAIAHGTKLAAIRHSINGRDTDGDFFAQ